MILPFLVYDLIVKIWGDLISGLLSAESRRSKWATECETQADEPGFRA